MRDSKGRFVKGSMPENGFKIGHKSGMVGKKHSVESKQKMSIAKKGRPNGRKGKQITEKQRNASIDNLKTFMKNNEPWNKGKKLVSFEEQMERKQKYNEIHKEESQLRSKIWYEKNRQYVIEKSKKWALVNKPKRLQIMQTHLRKSGFPFKMDPWRYQWAIYAWSKKVKSHYHNQCQICPNKAEVSHHIIHKSKYPALSLNVNNGIALCKKCHNEVHGWKLA